MGVCSELFGIPGPSSRDANDFGSGLGPSSLGILAKYLVRDNLGSMGPNSIFRFVHGNCFYISGGSAYSGVVFGLAIPLGSS